MTGNYDGWLLNKFFILFFLDRKHHSSDEKSKQKSSSSATSSKKHSSVADTNGFEAAMLGFDKPGKKEVKKKAESSSTSKSKDQKHEDPFKTKQNSQVPPPHHPVTVSVPNDLNPNCQPPAKEKLPPIAAANPAHLYSHLTDGKTDDEALSALISMSKNAKRTAVYSGSKR